ncbi:MAG: hypothetical protein ACKVX7_02105 [Planctomycetota bacterium]
MRPSAASALASLILALVIHRPAIAQVCSAAVFGPQDPLIITADEVIGPGCILDFGARDVYLEATFTTNDVTIIAARFTLANGGRINGDTFSTTTITTVLGGGYDGSVNINGIIDHNDGFLVGTIAIQAAGAVSIGPGGALRARGTTVDTDGGIITIQAGGNVVVDGLAPSIDLESGLDSTGGDLSITATGSITVMEPINALGGSFDGGTLTMVAGTDIITSDRLDIGARVYDDFAGYGGSVDLSAGGNISIGAVIDGAGPTGTFLDGGGDGGYVTLNAGGNISVSANIDLSSGYYAYGGVYAATCAGSYTQTAGRTRVDGRQIDSDGGDIVIDAGGLVTLAGTHEAGGGSDAYSGGIAIVGGLGLQVTGDMDARANISFDGITLSALAGDITLQSFIVTDGTGAAGEASPISLLAPQGAIALVGAHLDANGNAPDGFGGAIEVRAGLDITADAATRIRANGEGAGAGPAGTGGAITIEGCDISFAAGGQIRSRCVITGSVEVTGHQQINIQAEMLADIAGTITLNHAPAFPPVSAPSDPAAIPVPSTTLGPCYTPCVAVGAVSCESSPSGVQLTWVNLDAYVAIEIGRDGSPIAMLPAIATSYLDSAVAAGSHTYTVRGSCGGPYGTAVSCAVIHSPLVAFRRGECNGDGGFNIADAVSLLNYLFVPPPTVLACADACDANDDGLVNIADAIATLQALFGTPSVPLPAPYGSCGTDSTLDPLDCDSYTCP